MNVKVVCFTVNASCNGKRGQSGSVIAMRRRRSRRACSNISQVDAQLEIEKTAVKSRMEYLKKKVSVLSS